MRGDERLFQHVLDCGDPTTLGPGTSAFGKELAATWISMREGYFCECGCQLVTSRDPLASRSSAGVLSGSWKVQYCIDGLVPKVDQTQTEIRARAAHRLLMQCSEGTDLPIGFHRFRREDFLKSIGYRV